MTTESYSKTKYMSLCGLFAALTAICSWISIPLGFTPIPMNLATLAVFLAGGLLVENFIVQHRNEDKIWFNSFEGTTIGTKKIMKLHGLETDAVRILIVSSRDTPEINKIALY
jgi:hypothetical protein